MSVTVMYAPCRHGADTRSLSQLSPVCTVVPTQLGAHSCINALRGNSNACTRSDTHGGLTATFHLSCLCGARYNVRSVSAITLFSIPTVLSGLKSAPDCSLQRVSPTTPKQTAWGGPCRLGAPGCVSSIGNEGGAGPHNTNTALCTNEEGRAVAAWPSVCPPDHQGPPLSSWSAVQSSWVWANVSGLTPWRLP